MNYIYLLKHKTLFDRKKTYLVIVCFGKDASQIKLHWNVPNKEMGKRYIFNKNCSEECN